MEELMKKWEIVNGELRFWHGVKRRIPEGLQNLVIGFCIIKPDAIERGLKDEIIAILSKELNICIEKRIIFNEELIFELYPGFHESGWAKKLVNYLIRGESCAIILNGSDAVNKLMRLRNHIRQIYGQSNDGIVNLVHASDSCGDALREASIFFEEKEIIEAVMKK